ncbi:MAG TPA: HAD-IB family hydrolase [Solirubrobacteraceae bacterium]|nr:HAD-IB family hydrolase [Solirubrobacteraceae bacterium]
MGAFLDYDGTIIDGFSAGAFYRHRLMTGSIGPRELASTLLAAARGISNEDEFTAFLDLSLRAWADRPEEEIRELAERLFKHEIAGRLHHEMWRLAQTHTAMGHTLVVASSATRFQVEPMARELGAQHALFTPVEARDGILTGRRDGRPLWGEAKADAVRALAAEHGLDLPASYAYSNGDEDIPFLSVAGHPVAVSPEAKLRAHAEACSWPILRCASRPAIPDASALVRTAAFYGGMAAGMWAGVGIGLLRRSRQTIVELGGDVGSELGLALAGINVRILSGAEHLWSARPCVFLMNHQSKLDPIIAMRLLRGGFTGVAKKEAANVPGFGQFFRLAGVVFIDRTNTAQAKAALAPAVTKLREERISLLIAPEGTRSATPRLGMFKKGAFHIAMQARVPVVPIVIHNASEVMWRGSQTLHGGTVDVTVLPPVDTSRWSPATIDEHVAEIRRMYLDTLAESAPDALAESAPARPEPEAAPEPADPEAALLDATRASAADRPARGARDGVGA